MRQFEVCIFKVFRQALSRRWIRALYLTLLVILGHVAALRHKSSLHQFAARLSPRSRIWWPTNSVITRCSPSPWVSPGLFVCCVLSRFSCGRLFVTPWTVTPPGSSVPWDSPDKNTRVGCLLQEIFSSQGLKLCLVSLLRWQAGSSSLVLPGKPLGCLSPSNLKKVPDSCREKQVTFRTFPKVLESFFYILKLGCHWAAFPLEGPFCIKHAINRRTGLMGMLWGLVRLLDLLAGETVDPTGQTSRKSHSLGREWLSASILNGSHCNQPRNPPYSGSDSLKLTKVLS